tara:strand:- start:1121 stop:2446 length:1326 start_codon:yes stop_codon:yes gene_type:complete
VNLRRYQNRSIAIYGMGVTGCSAAKAFNRLRAKVFCWDDDAKIRKKIARNKKFVLRKFWLNSSESSQIDNIVVSPGIDIEKCKIKNFLRKNLKKIITDLDLFFELNKKNLIISITGTNGKSTTCKIIEKILKTAKYNVRTVGNIGNPILSSAHSKRKCAYVLEVSSYQLQYSKLFRSKHAAILNISPDHLERHKNMKNYTLVKSRIFLAQHSSDYSYINSKNKYLQLVKNKFKIKKLKSKLFLINKSDYSFLLKQIESKYFESEGNFENMVFAYKIAKNLKINEKIIIKALKEFKGLPHRQEYVFSKKNILCINDSKATSFDASLQSLANYKNIFWIVGGIPKLQDRFYLNRLSKKIIKAYIIGKHPSFFVRQIKKKISYNISHNIRIAIQNILDDIKKIKKNKKYTILLSPAAASFDQFKNFEERGNLFKFLIKNNFKND